MAASLTTGLPEGAFDFGRVIDLLTKYTDWVRGDRVYERDD